MKFEDVLEIKNVMFPGELKYLKNVLNQVKEKDKSIVNVGCYYGASSASLLLGMQENEITGDLFLIDAFKYHGGSKPKMEPFRERKDISWSSSFLEETKNNLAKFSKGETIHYIEGFSDDASLDVIGEISLVFIDADHSTHGCLLDALKYSQKLISGGIMLFHDYNLFPSVQRAISIFLSIRPDFKIQKLLNSILTIKKD